MSMKNQISTARFFLERVLTETNLRISSIIITGTLITNTAFHSSQLRGVMANNSYDTTLEYTERVKDKKRNSQQRKEHRGS